jgi:HPt (histidine-containing phosphotransfer) domain-containing protein
MSDKNIVYVDEDLEELVPDFLQNRRDDVSTIRELLRSGDLKEVQRIGHSMKGSGGGYGFDEITVIGSKIEEAAKVGDVTVIKEASDHLESYLASVHVVYQELD